MRPDNTVSRDKMFFEHCKSGIQVAMRLVLEKENLNAADIQVLKVLGDLYELMENPSSDNMHNLREDCNKSDLLYGKVKLSFDRL